MGRLPDFRWLSESSDLSWSRANWVRRVDCRVPVQALCLGTGQCEYSRKWRDPVSIARRRANLRADEIGNLTYEYWYEPAGTLFVIALADAWELPRRQDEAEQIIAALISLN